ncbi:putative phage-related endonuclease [Paraburkholderia sp. HC6.4b]|uniref:YqaJ viral recombinase family protein n=1 Tax=unclassified Paraburkholderia TaxID=2615204 RepID=UPI00160EB9AA|nr:MULTISPECIES: YqaJ viral recombinase family protein [unclassified Paraburkholderia]MBB5411867.1 putative phage-related endonuclease [Paraburkholderia sp. HC6.4b]MBB5450179.1 putative phage-related endonuclease [Paraburkholderia sp. Kb1A]
MTDRTMHNLVQGSDEWMAFRLTRFGASEAAAMLGLSSKVKRTELLHMKHTGNPKEFSDWVQQNILDYGHEVEALARPIVEEMIGDDLYPVTYSDGNLSASSDGLTMDEITAFEHKQWNDTLAASITDGVLPEEHTPQAQQVLMVTGAERLIFACSDGTRERFVWMEVLPDPAWFDRLRAGWAQFEKDLADYQPREIAEKPQAEAIMQLPALAVQIRGEVITSNLPAFKSAAEQFIANIKMDLKTDEDFVNADATVKFCEAKEKEIAIAMDAAIAQMSSIDELMRTGKYVSEQLRKKRLALSSQIEQRKKQIKESAIAERRQKYAAHVEALNNALGDASIVVATPDFAGAIKGLKTIASANDKLDTALANGKIDADAAARDLRTKLDWYQPRAKAHGFLFSDLQQLIQKPAEDFELAVTTRIEQHKRAEEERRAREAAAQTSAPAPEQVKTGALPAVQSALPIDTPAPIETGVRSRPAAGEIVAVLSRHYGANPRNVLNWLCTTDWRAVQSQGEQHNAPLRPYDDMLRQILKCSDAESLDELEYQARAYPESQRIKLMQAYDDRREVLLGA